MYKSKHAQRFRKASPNSFSVIQTHLVSCHEKHGSQKRSLWAHVCQNMEPIRYWSWIYLDVRCPSIKEGQRKRESLYVPVVPLRSTVLLVRFAVKLATSPKILCWHHMWGCIFYRERVVLLIKSAVIINRIAATNEGNESWRIAMMNSFPQKNIFLYLSLLAFLFLTLPSTHPHTCIHAQADRQRDRQTPTHTHTFVCANVYVWYYFIIIIIMFFMLAVV